MFEDKAARVVAVSRAEHYMERTRRSVAMLGALGLGVGSGLALAETRSPWVFGCLLVYGFAMMGEAFVMHRQLNRSMTLLADLTKQARETA